MSYRPFCFVAAFILTFAAPPPLDADGGDNVPVFNEVSQHREETVFPGDDWEYRTTPAERADLGIDSMALDAWVENLAAFPANTGMVIRRGYVIAAWGRVDDGLQAWVSAWKSQVGMAAFLAHDAGWMPDFEEPIRPLVQAAFSADLIPGDRTMTFADLGRNISGYGRVEAPGGAFAYADASPTLASQLVSEAVADVEADGWFAYLLSRIDPADGSGIGFQDEIFSIRRSTRDAARMAWLWANEGRWADQQLIPAGYFRRYVKPLTPFELPESSAVDPINGDYLGIGGTEIAARYQVQGAYGYWWYFNNRPVTRPGDENVSEPTRKLPGLPHDAFTAFGTGGKYILAIPSLDMALALNSYSGRDWSGLIDAVTDADRTPPTAPTGLEAAAISSRTVTLHWAAADDPETGVAKYWIYRDGAWIGEVPGGVNIFTDSGLTPQASYRYDIQAFNGHGYATDVVGGHNVTTAPRPAVFSVNFGSSIIGGLVPIPRSESFVAGVVAAPWWNNHFHGPGNWREMAQNDVPWVLCDGSEPTGLRLRTTSPTNNPTEVIYASTQTIGHTEDSTNLRLHTDSYVNSSANHHMVGVDAENLPADFGHGWNLYAITHYSSVWAHGIHRFDLDLGMDGVIDRTIYSLQQPPGDWTEDTAFGNASQSDEAETVGSEHSSYVVFKGLPPGRTSFSLSVTNINPAGRRASLNALQVEALEEPTNYFIWVTHHLWKTPGIDDQPLANPDRDQFSNLEEYALDLDPLRYDGLDHSPRVAVVEESGEIFLTLTYRINALARDLSQWPLGSINLENWVKLDTAPPDVVDEIIDPDPDGDGSAILRRLKLRLSGIGEPERFFLRMFFRKD